MERRLMLSSTPLEFPPVAIYAVVAPISNSSFQLPSESNHIVSPNVQDGFISIADSLVLISSDVSGTLVNFNSFDVVIRGNFTQAGTVSDAWLSPGSLDTNAFDDNSLQTNAVHSTAFYNLEMNLRPIFSEPLASPLYPGDGGMIAIRPLLGRTEVEAPTKSISTEKVAPSSDSSQPSASSPATLRGEWARAAVFEIAGGDASTHVITPSKSKTPSSKVDVEELNLGRSSASKFLGQPIHGSGHASTAALSRDAQPMEMSAIETARPFARRNFTSAVPVLSVIESNATTVDRTQSTAADSVSQAVRIAKATTPDDDASSIGADDGSNRTSHDGVAIVESSRAGIWTRFLGATPLLVLLVWERLAALHSRRASREIQAMAPARPGMRLLRRGKSGSV